MSIGRLATAMILMMLRDDVNDRVDDVIHDDLLGDIVQLEVFVDVIIDSDDDEKAVHRCEVLQGLMLIMLSSLMSEFSSKSMLLMPSVNVDE